jgi:hypothetical protein
MILKIREKLFGESGFWDTAIARLHHMMIK